MTKMLKGISPDDASDYTWPEDELARFHAYMGSQEPPPSNPPNGHAQIGTTPFGLYAPLLLRNGYSPVPIEPGDKRPLGAIGDWNRLRQAPLTVDEIAAIAAEYPNAGLGVVGGYGDLVPIDIDTEDPDICAAIDVVLREPLVSKRGRRGATVFCRDPSGRVKSRKFKSTDGVMMLEVLATGQVVIPPTLHPETKQPYIWLTDYNLLQITLDELPVLQPDLCERLQEALGRWLPAQRDYKQLKPNGAASAAPASPKRMRAYAEAALDGERQILAGMPPNSGRNRRLFDVGCKLGKYVHHGLLSHEEVEDAVVGNACKANGLVDEDGLYACKKSLTSGLRKAEGDDLPFLPDRDDHKSEQTYGSTSDHCTPCHGDVSDPDMSVIRRNRTAAAEFPLDVFGSAAPWVKTVAESKSAPVSYVALNLLVVTAGCIGPKRRVSPWDGWDEPSILWGGLVGEPSQAKSPSMDPFRDAARGIERAANGDWEFRRAEFENEKQVAEARRAHWEQEVKQAVKVKQEPPPLPSGAIEPKVPTKCRLWIVDATTEKVARILGENRCGLISFRDELAGLLGGFDRYGGSGSDRAFWIEAYGGRPYRYDRVSLDEPIDIPFCAISLIGTLQPDRLNTMLLAGDDDGLAARLLYAWPDPVPPRRPSKGADHTVVQAALQRLWDLPFDRDTSGNTKPRITLLEADAADEFQAWWEHKQWNAKLSAGGKLAGAIGKLDGVALRLAQVLEFLDWSWSKSNLPEPERVSTQSVRKALRIIDDWVRPNLERVFAEASLSPAQREAMTVGRWLIKTKPKAVNARDLRRQPGFPGPKDTKALDAALELLVDAHWLTPASNTGPGRPRKDYEVNQAVFEAGR
jgi:hypothetical protein